MIAPDKYVPIDASLIGIGATMLKQMTGSTTVTALWETCRTLPAVGTFHRFVLALDLLYALGAVELEGGMITRTVL